MSYQVQNSLSPHHDGSDLYVSNSAPKIGDNVTLKIRIPKSYNFERVMVRMYHDGEPRIFELKKAKSDQYESWYQVSVKILNLQNYYRFVFIGNGKYEWLNARGVFDHDVHSNNDFQLVATPANPNWINSAVFYQIFPDRFAKSGDETAFAAILDRHGPMLLGLCRRLVGERLADEAEHLAVAIFNESAGLQP